METRILTADVTALACPDVFADWYEKMPISRKRKIDACAGAENRRLSLGAGILLLTACGTYPEEAMTDTGKPYFPALPNLHFSLSHAGTRVMCAVSEVSVGCDVEVVNPAHVGVAKRFFTAEEQAALARAEHPTETFYRLWTLHEACLKQKGLGVCGWEQIGTLVLSSDTSDAVCQACGVFTREYFGVRGYCLSAASERNILPADIREVQI